MIIQLRRICFLAISLLLLSCNNNDNSDKIVKIIKQRTFKTKFQFGEVIADELYTSIYNTDHYENNSHENIYLNSKNQIVKHEKLKLDTTGILATTKYKRNDKGSVLEKLEIDNLLKDTLLSVYKSISHLKDEKNTYRNGKKNNRALYHYRENGKLINSEFFKENGKYKEITRESFKVIIKKWDVGKNYQYISQIDTFNLSKRDTLVYRAKSTTFNMLNEISIQKTSFSEYDTNKRLIKEITIGVAEPMFKGQKYKYRTIANIINYTYDKQSNLTRSYPTLIDSFSNQSTLSDIEIKAINTYNEYLERFPNVTVKYDLFSQSFFPNNRYNYRYNEKGEWISKTFFKSENPIYQVKREIIYLE